MKKTIILSAALIISIFSMGQWLTQTTGFNAAHECIHCVDSQHCLIGAWDGTVLKTTDGSNWTDAGNGIEKTANVISTVFCLDEQHCLASSALHLYKTDNGAVSWTEVLTPEQGLYCFQFLNELEGYALAGGKLLKTIDGGANWLVQTSNLPFSLNTKAQLLAVRNGVSLAVVQDIANKKRFIYRSVDGGINWNMQFQDSLISPSRDLQFASDSVLYLCGATNGYLLKSTDSGLTWNPLSNPFTDEPEGFLALDFISAQSGYLLGPQGVFLKTIDGGESWLSENYATATPFVSVSIGDSETAYAVGNGNVLAKNGNAQLLTLEEFLVDPQVIIYPNPAQDEIQIEAEHWQANMEFLLLDLQGRIVFRQLLQQSKNHIETSQFSRGSYLYQIQFNQHSVSGGKISLN